MNKVYWRTLPWILTLVLSACNAPASAPSPSRPRAERLSSAATAPGTPFVTPSPIATAATPTTRPQQPVMVTAVHGNVFIRRGPDLAYNAVTVLMDGKRAEASARDVLGEWLQVHLAGHPDATGWISIQTHFVSVSGDPMSLPELMPTDWPRLASLRNCTDHEMTAQPGGIVIPSLGNFPENDVQINPGVYTIHDIDVDGSPEVMRVEIREGSQIDIRQDGDGNRHKCPIP